MKIIVMYINVLIMIVRMLKMIVKVIVLKIVYVSVLMRLVSRGGVGHWIELGHPRQVLGESNNEDNNE